MTDTNNSTPYVKTMLKLPQEVADAFARIQTDERDAYIVALRLKGWTLASIAEVAGVTRERVRQIVNSWEETDNLVMLAVADLPQPLPPLKKVKTKRVYTEPSEDTLARLLELQPIAEKYRANAAPEVKAAALEYTQLIDHANRIEGVPLYRLAKRLGKTHGALRFRLARYGLREPVSASSKAYRLLSKFVFAFMVRFV